jgi:hypothetical protein
LHRLHVQGDPVDFFQIWRQPPDYVRCADF